MAELVSIITPCYNGEKYLDRYFNSILEQTYPNVELIFVNDGSTDRTEEIALVFGEKLKARGYGFTYIYQQNAGQSAAINQGLKVFKGTYLNWMDSDDYLPADSIEKRVTCMIDNPDIGLVLGACDKVEDKGYTKIGDITSEGCDMLTKRELIEEFISGRIGCPCCSTMVRSSMFRESMPETIQIETPREIGQNYQLFIPIMFKYPVKYLSDVLSYYVVHSDSHSHRRKTYEQRIHILDVSALTLNSIADRLCTGEEDIRWFKNKIEEYDCKNRLEVLQHCRRLDDLSEIVSRLKSVGCYDASVRKIVLKIKYPFAKKVGDRIWRLKYKK